jgi:hypothetical protein
MRTAILQYMMRRGKNEVKKDEITGGRVPEKNGYEKGLMALLIG